jgi:hypothetical protein
MGIIARDASKMAQKDAPTGKDRRGEGRALPRAGRRR